MIRNSRSLTSIAVLVVAAYGCDAEPTRPMPHSSERDYAVVLNSVGLTLTVFPTDVPDAAIEIPLGATGTPASFAVRNGIALVPLGTVPAVAVVDLGTRAVDFVALPEGSGATGVAIVDDSLAFVGNPELNTVSPVRYRDGYALGAIPVGRYPTALIAHDDRVYVLEANLVDFVPDGPSTISVIDASALEVDTTFTLSGRNAGDAVLSGDTMLYVLNRGDFGLANGSVSAVPLPAVVERERFDQFGEGTGTLSELYGNLLVSSYTYGLALYDPRARTFAIPPGSGVFPPDAENVLGAAVGPDNRLYSIDAGDCTEPGRVWVWEGQVRDVEYAEPVTVGSCPIDIVFTSF